MNREKIHKALALLNSMILSGEQHSETSQKILNDAVNELSAPQQVSVEPVVKVQIAEEKQNTHNMDIIHLGCCTKCGGINFTNQNCKWWDSNLSA